LIDPTQTHANQVRSDNSKSAPLQDVASVGSGHITKQLGIRNDSPQALSSFNLPVAAADQGSMGVTNKDLQNAASKLPDASVNPVSKGAVLLSSPGRITRKLDYLGE
jgi:hypothetical protein